MKLTPTQRAAAWKKANPERAATWRRVWLEQTRETRLAKMRVYARQNRAAARARRAAWMENNPSGQRSITRRAYVKRKDYYYAANAKRRAAKYQAIPSWYGELDELVMQEAADLAKRRKAATGFKWHTDHIVPLCSKLVCGLHVYNNIQVIPAVLNHRKGNRFWPDMPA